MAAVISAIERVANSLGPSVNWSDDRTRFEALCPAHDDHHPSLSVSVGDDQPVVVHCHAGRAPKEVLGAVGLTFEDISRLPTEPDATSTKIDEIYPYEDRDGRVVLEVVRYSPKAFRQRRPAGRGGFIWDTKGVEPVPYRLPQLLAACARGDRVWVVEGEKDVEALRAVGQVATCNAGGAGKWRPEFAKHLVGAECVFVVADKDDAGRRHARDIANSLQALDVVVHSFEAADGCRDIAEHLADGYELLDLVEIVLAPTPGEIDSATQADHDHGRIESSLIDWDEFWSKDHRAEDWLIPNLVARGRGHALHAGAKTGKSLVVLSAVAAYVTGRSVFGQDPVEPGRVLYLDYEMTQADVFQRLSDMGYGPDDDLSGQLLYASLPSLRALDGQTDGIALCNFSVENEVDLVVLDTTSRAVAGEENSADTYQDLYSNCLQYLKAAGIATLRLDHSGKDPARGQRGSSAKNDDVDVVWKLQAVQGGFTLTATHRRMEWVPEKVVLEMSNNDGYLNYKIKARSDSWPDGTKDLARRLGELGVTADTTLNAALATLRAKGEGRRTTLVGAALRWLKAEIPKYSSTWSSRSGTGPESPNHPSPGTETEPT